MSESNFAALSHAIVTASVADNWESAVLEWAMVDVQQDPQGVGICACGQTGLVDLFTIYNILNGAYIFPIGSVCIRKFEREDLTATVNLLGSLLDLRNKIVAGKPISLTSEHFSRAILGYLHENGAFTPDQWNSNRGTSDYEFLLKMFNKRNKDEITQAQHRKIAALLRRKVFPFINSDPRLR